MSDVSEFWVLTQRMEHYEKQKAEAKSALKDIYAELVKICPHPEAVEWDTKILGKFRACVVCGVEDHASEGGTPGDEYNYGYPGHPSKSFWAESAIRTITEKESWDYRKSHAWVVSGGRLKNRTGE